MIILSQKWPKLLYFYVQSQSINIPLNLSNALKSSPTFHPPVRQKSMCSVIIAKR